MNRFKIAATAVVAAVSTLAPGHRRGGARHTSSFGCPVTPYAPTPVQSGVLGPNGRRMAKYKVDVTWMSATATSRSTRTSGSRTW